MTDIEIETDELVEVINEDTSPHEKPVYVKKKRVVSQAQLDAMARGREIKAEKLRQIKLEKEKVKVEKVKAKVEPKNVEQLKSPVTKSPTGVTNNNHYYYYSTDPKKSEPSTPTPTPAPVRRKLRIV